METVKLSPKFQLVVPKKIREQLDLRPGQELRVFAVDGGLRFIKPRSVKELRGIAKGIRWQDEDRDHSERF